MASNTERKDRKSRKATISSEGWKSTKELMRDLVSTYLPQKSDVDKFLGDMDKRKTEFATALKAKKTSTKKTTSGYLLFCSDYRAEVRNSGFTGPETMRELGRMWRESDEDERKTYNDKAAALKAQWASEEKTATEPARTKPARSKPAAKSTKPAKEAVKDTTQHKAFLLFAKEQRPQLKKDNPTMKRGELTQELQDMWDELDDEEREDYEERCS